MADSILEKIGWQRKVVLGGMGAQLGFLLVELGQGFFDQVAVELVRRTMRCLVIARAVPVRKRESQVLEWVVYGNSYGVGGLTSRRDKRRTA